MNLNNGSINGIHYQIKHMLLPNFHSTDSLCWIARVKLFEVQLTKVAKKVQIMFIGMEGVVH